MAFVRQSAFYRISLIQATTKQCRGYCKTRLGYFLLNNSVDTYLKSSTIPQGHIFLAWMATDSAEGFEPTALV